MGAVRQPSLSKFYLDRIQQVRSFANRTFHSLVALRRLVTWGLKSEPTKEVFTHELTTRRHKLFISLRLELLICLDSNKFSSYRDGNHEREQKEGFGRRESRPGGRGSPLPTSSIWCREMEDLSKTVDMENLPSRRGHKKARHGSFKLGVVKAGSFVLPALAKQPSTVQILDVDPSNPPEVTLSKPPSGSLITLLMLNHSQIKLFSSIYLTSISLHTGYD